MSDRMTPPGFIELLREVIGEYRSRGTILDVPVAPHVGPPRHTLFGQPLEAPLGPAAGPHTQLAGNIVAAYAAGARWFELKTVQTLDGADLPVEKPCIYAPDECYNVEWSTELTVEQAQAEYIKADLIIKLLAREFALGDPQAFCFNMSVGYDLAGISSPKIDNFIEGLKDATVSGLWQEYVAQALESLSLFERVDAAYIAGLSPRVCSSVTLSTLHGCPPQEIERIAAYLIEKKHLHTLVKCNPTLLGYEETRQLLDGLGFDYLAFDDRHFKEDLQFADAVPLLLRLRELAGERGLSLGVKLTNTMPVEIDARQLPGREMYMSGRSLFPLALSVAARLSAAFQGGLPISFSGGVDTHNIAALLSAGIKPLTLATALLKPGGYARLTQLTEMAGSVAMPETVDAAALGRLAREVVDDEYYRKPAKTAPARRLSGPPPLFDCFAAPCRHACPLAQDAPAYLQALAAGDDRQAARIVLERNPLPHITGAICSHPCMASCNRRHVDQAVDIRGCKLLAAGAAEAVIRELLPVKRLGKKAVVVGGGPAGLAAAAFLQRAGWQATVMEREEQPGGVVRQIIPDFRIGEQAIAADVGLVRALGAEIKCGSRVKDLAALRRAFDAVFVAIGAEVSSAAGPAQGPTLLALDFLARCKQGEQPSLGQYVCVIGGGNTAMDAARVARRCPGVRQVSIVYRRDRRNMPADLEELEMAELEDIVFRPLLAPKSWQDNILTCEAMRLGAPDASGRRAPLPSGELVDLPCQTLISATGSHPDRLWLAAQKIKLNAQGLPELEASGESSLDNVYVIGDAGHGAATVVEAIAAAERAVVAATGCRFDRYAAQNKQYRGLAGRGRVEAGSAHARPERCLECGGLCALCVEVCPNRANRLVGAAGERQVVHLDALCNECGNCDLFCPYEGAPYRNKLTIFTDEDAFNHSSNCGVAVLPDGRYLLRHRGIISELCWEDEQPPALAELIAELRQYCK